ncbi:MAG: trigger factor [Blastocatellia bacterium]|nr:trigger factor [Blastocatellia bacterium]
MKLAVEVVEISQSKKDLRIEVDRAEVKAELEKAYENLARNVKIPGFRPGHVPTGIVKQRFEKEVKEDVTHRLVEHALSHAIIDNRLRLVGQPRIGELTLGEGESLKFKATIEVLPDFELKSYKGLSAKKVIKPVLDNDVENVLQRWRDEAAEFVPIEDRPAQDGDFLALSLNGKYADEPGEIKTDDLQIELGSDHNQSEFNENLRGVKAGDKRQFSVSYPEDFGSKKVAGKTVDFTIEVVAVREKELPELDDEFAREYAERETLQQLRDDIKADLMRGAEARAEISMNNDLLAQVTSGYDFEVPESMVEEHSMQMVREFTSDLVRQGYSQEQIRAIDWVEQMKKLREQAVKDLRTFLVLARIADAEGIRVSDEELDHEILRMAHEQGERFEQLKARLTKEDALSSIEGRLTNLKALGVIAKSAEVTVEELSEEPDLEKQAEKQETV